MNYDSLRPLCGARFHPSTVVSPIMENRMEKKVENEMETGGFLGFKELNVSY